jgi:hypothetical protein
VTPSQSIRVGHGFRPWDSGFKIRELGQVESSPRIYKLSGLLVQKLDSDLGFGTPGAGIWDLRFRIRDSGFGTRDSMELWLKNLGFGSSRK